MLVDQNTKEPIVRTHVHVPLAGEPAYGGQGGSGWTTPVLRPQDGGKANSESRLVEVLGFLISLINSSIRSVNSVSSKRQTMSKSTPESVNRAIPGPGDEIESDPDAGVLDSEKVSVVFLVSRRFRLVHAA